jgi:hypothetical protein
MSFIHDRESKLLSFYLCEKTDEQLNLTLNNPNKSRLKSNEHMRNTGRQPGIFRRGGIAIQKNTLFNL